MSLSLGSFIDSFGILLPKCYPCTVEKYGTDSCDTYTEAVQGSTKKIFCNSLFSKQIKTQIIIDFCIFCDIILS